MNTFIRLVTGLFIVTQPAMAHVFLRDDQATAGGQHFVTIIVPTEAADCTTTRVRVQIPQPIVFVSPRVTAGWEMKVKTRKLQQPVSFGDYRISEAIAEIEWSGGAIPSGFHAAFDLVVYIPAQASGALYFKTLQTCGATEIRWIDVPDGASARQHGAHPGARIAPSLKVRSKQ